MGIEDDINESLSQTWGLQTQSQNLSQDPFADVRRALSEKIALMLDREPQKLTQAFYRLDVNSEKAEAILKTAPLSEVSDRLAQLVIEREIEKAKTRAKYSKPQ